MKKLSLKRGFALMEILVVMGIFSLMIGAAFTLLASGRFSWSISEAQVEAEENVRRAIEGITRELRLSQAGHLCISDDVLSANNQLLGSVTNFQVPVIVDGEVSVDAQGHINWGSQDTEDHRIGYYLEGSQLRRIEFDPGDPDLPADVGDLEHRVLGNHILAITFSRADVKSNLVSIVITSQRQTPQGAIVQATLRSEVRLRN